MKKNIRKLAVVCLTGAFAFVHYDGSAYSKPSREKCGRIAEVNSQSKTLTVISQEEGKPLNLIWTDRTKFVQQSRLTDSDSVAEGRRACVIYRSPVFGKPFATKIVVRDQP